MFEAGTKVEIMERGEWVGPFTVVNGIARSENHLILEGNSGSFEHYADEFNTREYVKPEEKTYTLEVTFEDGTEYLNESTTEAELLSAIHNEAHKLAIGTNTVTSFNYKLNVPVSVGVEKPFVVSNKGYSTNKELIIHWFIRNHTETPNSFGDIEFIEHHDTGSNYRIHFPSGRVSDWNVHYEQATIVDMTEYNVVIERG